MPSAMTLALISGSLRAGSTNTALLQTVPHLVGPGVETVLYQDMAALPHFNPDDDYAPLDAAVERLRALLDRADAVLFCTPEYAGSLPGSFKNLLDWTVGGTEIVDRPVGWINASPAPTGARGAHEALRTVLGYTGADIVEAGCAHVPVHRTDIDPHSVTVTGGDVRERVTAAVGALLAYAGGRRKP